MAPHMARTAAAVVVLAGCCIHAEHVPHSIAEAQRGWGAAYEAGDVYTVRLLLPAGSVVVPPGAAGFVAGADAMEAYMAAEAAERGRPRLALWPMDGIALNASNDGGVPPQYTPAAFHTVGMDARSNASYYMRMVRGDHGDWRIDTAVIGAKEVRPVQREPAVPEWLRERLHDLRVRLHEADYAGAVDAHFAADAVAVPRGGARLLRGADIAGELKELTPSPTVPHPHLFRLGAIHADPATRVTHVLADQVSVLTGWVSRCYMRWVRERIDVLVVSTGVACEGPPCKKWRA